MIRISIRSKSGGESVWPSKNRTLFPKSIFENVAWGAHINGFKDDMDSLVEESLQGAALWDEVKDKLDQSGLSLSGGQQQRLCIARTIAVKPDIILYG